MIVLETIKTEKLRKFIEEMLYKNRNPINNGILEMLRNKNTNPEIILNRGSLLYRSRIITDDTIINIEPNFYGYERKGSFVPKPEFTRDMRANYKFIPYLYCSNNAYITIAEVRPIFGEKISVAKIMVKETILLLDFTVQDKTKCVNDFEKENLFEDLSQLFAKPITKEDETTDYIPTQYIAEYVKNLGYDGIAYSSSIVPEFCENGYYNIVIFNHDKCEAIQSNVFKVNHIYFEAEQIDDCDNKLNVDNKVAQQLKGI